MIIQSDNHPSIIVLTDDLSGMEQVSCALCAGTRILKTWTKSDITFTTVDDGYALSLPWTQEETSQLPSGVVYWDLKALDTNGVTQFWDSATDTVVRRCNKEVLS